MGILDGPLRQIASDLLAKFGRAVTLRFQGSVIYPTDGSDGRVALSVVDTGLRFKDLGNGRCGIAADGDLVGLASGGRLQLGAASSSGAYDPVTRSVTRFSEDQPVRIVEEPWKARPGKPGERGTHPTKGRDALFTMAAKGLLREPTTDDQVVEGTKVLEILDVDPVHSGDEVALYQVHVRR